MNSKKRITLKYGLYNFGHKFNGVQAKSNLNLNRIISIENILSWCHIEFQTLNFFIFKCYPFLGIHHDYYFMKYLLPPTFPSSWSSVSRRYFFDSPKPIQTFQLESSSSFFFVKIKIFIQILKYKFKGKMFQNLRLDHWTIGPFLTRFLYYYYTGSRSTFEQFVLYLLWTLVK